MGFTRWGLLGGTCQVDLPGGTPIRYYESTESNRSSRCQLRSRDSSAGLSPSTGVRWGRRVVVSEPSVLQDQKLTSRDLHLLGDPGVSLDVLRRVDL